MRHLPPRLGLPPCAPDGIPSRGGLAMFGGRYGGEPPPKARHAPESRCPAERLFLAMPSWARAFPGAPVQVRAARRFVSALLDGSAFRDDAVIVVCELFTNALVHSRSGKPGGLVTVQVSRWRLGVRIAVTDQGSARAPVIRDTGPCRELAENGHGLYMVSCLATCLGWHDDASGRTIHAILGEPSADCSPEPASRACESSRLPQLA